MIRLLKHPKNFGLIAGIERTGWLVGDQQSRTMKQGECEHDTLRLTNADFEWLAREKVLVFGQVDLLEEAAQP